MYKNMPQATNMHWAVGHTHWENNSIQQILRQPCTMLCSMLHNTQRSLPGAHGQH